MNSPSLPFIKASACGNDFLLIDAAAASENLSELTRRICDRHFGVGADGVEWMSPHFSADAEIRLINADGSPAEISGNGTRCVAAYLYSTRAKERVSILTGAGVKICTLTGKTDAGYEFETEMGQAVAAEEMSAKIGLREVRGVPVSIGNPHFVSLVSEFSAGWQELAADIQRNPHFPDGVNVEFVRIDSRHELTARFFERGAGETQSSGTGSCASAVAAIASRRAESPVKVHAPGGTQLVRTEGNRIFLRGPAKLICRGEFLLE